VFRTSSGTSRICKGTMHAVYMRSFGLVACSRYMTPQVAPDRARVGQNSPMVGKRCAGPGPGATKLAHGWETSRWTGPGSDQTRPWLRNVAPTTQDGLYIDAIPNEKWIRVARFGLHQRRFAQRGSDSYCGGGSCQVPRSPSNWCITTRRPGSTRPGRRFGARRRSGTI
jgi:hypothetical protein